MSRYFIAKGKRHLLHPCEGLLIGELAPALRDARSWRRWKPEECLPCDLTLQAITVKGPRVARFSNITWHLNHLSVAGGERDLFRFFVLLMNGLEPHDPVDVGALVPSAIARVLANTIDRTIQNFREYFRLGVNWLMPYNNFTMDGRFCDLDVPLFSGPGYVGAALSRESWRVGSSTARAPDHVDFGSIFGLNVIPFLHQMRVFLRCLHAGLGALLGANFCYSEAEKGFMAGFVRALAEVLPPDHVLWSGAACADMVKLWLDEDCHIVPSRRGAIHALVDHAVALRLEHTTTAGMSFPVEEVTHLRCARAGVSPNLTTSFYAIAGSEVRPERLAEAQLLNDWIAKLDLVTDRDEFLSTANEAVRQIDEQCHP